MNRAKVVTLIVLCCSSFPLAAQHARVAGRIQGGEHQTPLDNANVFLANTRLGASTGSDGAFRIYGIPPGTYTLVVSRVGYRLRTKQIFIAHGDSIFLTFTLQEQPLLAEGVQSTAAAPMEWRKLLKVFVREFIGVTSNASETRLLNPEVLNLRRDSITHFLIATSDSIIRIENAALGYRISLLMPKFRWSTDDDVGEYLVLPRFESLNDATPAMIEEWEQNRRRSYSGSLPHFLKSLVRGTLERDGFTVHIGKLKALRDGLYHPWSSNDFIVSQLAGTTLRRLSFDGWLRIEYRGTRRRTSFLSLKEDAAIIDEQGHVNSPLCFEVLGDWTEDRVAEMLPRDLYE